MSGPEAPADIYRFGRSAEIDLPTPHLTDVVLDQSGEISDARERFGSVALTDFDFEDYEIIDAALKEVEGSAGEVAKTITYAEKYPNRVVTDDGRRIVFD